MAGPTRGAGPRSNIYSESRFTNWATHDPHELEINALPPRMRAAGTIARAEGQALRIFERPLMARFVRPISVTDVESVLTRVPRDFLSELSGVFLLGGTDRQRRLRSPTYGLYWRSNVYLCPLAVDQLSQRWDHPPKPNVAQQYTKFGARFTPAERGAVTLTFDEPSLRMFYLYDVLLHEIGHHVSQHLRGQSAERYAQWFADFQQARLRERVDDTP
jgi:hypothetical protein